MPIQTLFTDPGGYFLMVVCMIPGVIISLTFRQYVQALVSTKLGDPTPRNMGRLTLNPVSHVDPIGLVLMFTIGFGLVKPVINNPAYYKNKRMGQVLFSLSGILTNFVIALLFYPVWILLIRAGVTNMIILDMIQYCILRNISLMVFYLMPVPPLDGYRIVKAIFMTSPKAMNFFWQVERLGTLPLWIVILTNAGSTWILSLSQLVLNLIYSFWRFLM
ncbi:site-2 protease family protein [Eubacteriales bacterium OttesenSCG-928-N14]|nr:site-2 protease family protein [Eubacteriales bacterium OttesenSCG-928-N14]